ncbi:MAG: hypothetical protein AAF667_03480 [Pseudomonadota bacterium]
MSLQNFIPEFVLLLAAFGAVEAAPAPYPVECSFPQEQHGRAELRLELIPRPTGLEAGGPFPIEMRLQGTDAFTAVAQPITTTPGRDIMVRARVGSDTFLTVGLQEDGAAAFNVFKPKEDPPQQTTLTGSCTNMQTLFDARPDL